MPESDRPYNFEALSYGLVLLQEICQGYDTPIYRNRAIRQIAYGGSPYIGGQLLPDWKYGKITTQDLIHCIEKALVDVYAS